MARDFLSQLDVTYAVTSSLISRGFGNKPETLSASRGSKLSSPRVFGLPVCEKLPAADKVDFYLSFQWTLRVTD